MDGKKRVVAIGCSGCGALAALAVKKLKPFFEVTIIREPNEKVIAAKQESILRCAGQPELSPDPGREPIALAAESVFEELYSK
ncbi:MAG: hypothetical protein ABII89_02505 [Candidatus Omnitrophota bacterium]